MSTLLLRLAAPLQSWGSDAKFERRGTERVPTKSGVIGMIAAALGRRRHESVEDLLRLRFGVRVDREGALLRDFHTARRDKLAYVTHRYYLADAVFLVGLEGSEEQLTAIDRALRQPAYPLFLGRRSCPPEGRVSLGIRSGRPLLSALQEEPPLTDRKPSQWRFVYDAEPGESRAYVQRDLPLSYDSAHRKHGFRRIAEKTMPTDTAAGERHPEQATDHDPFLGLEGD
ncbi:type I-E CRISPR-associated protein Cas5/CasD [Paenibacillus ginsengihumi]|uniref:type I-E CRISPR-associated protein Cas5/CasD n=1 Tax=Paenibacillus ginsengihumi TaxID=431596 RepID=UPI000375EAB8|nr:type I-E CRISPR-associated protein Cas5/CasD [Paenibacillus ginsengihumi]